MANNKKSQSEIILTVSASHIQELLGEHNSKFKIVANAFPEVSMLTRGNSIRITGDKKKTQEVKAIFEILQKVLKKEGHLSPQAITELLNGHNPYDTYLSGDSNFVIVQGRHGRAIKARTKNQKRLVEASNDNDVVFAIGPAGTGKTYTAVALAVRALKLRMVKKIILTRPAVEAGESLGFLPGDLKDKIDPYLRPLYDALDDMIPNEKLQQLMTNRTIEVAPLAFMRGRTLDNAFIILDEAQNATSMQLKMFLTRLGPSAKSIITGDLSQIDLPFSQKSGLRRSTQLLGGIKGISVVELTADDVVRHRLVKQIILRYGEEDTKRREEREADKYNRDRNPRRRRYDDNYHREEEE